MTSPHDTTVCLLVGITVMLESCIGPLACYDAALADSMLDDLHAVHARLEN